MSYEIKFEDNSDKFKAEWGEKKLKILYSWGLMLQKIATLLLTRNQQVITGRLRASISFITPNKVGKPIYKNKDSKPDDYLSGSSEEDSLVLGSNVIYARNVELNSRKGAFLRPAVMEYREDLKNITKSVMKE